MIITDDLLRHMTCCATSMSVIQMTVLTVCGIVESRALPRFMISAYSVGPFPPNSTGPDAGPSVRASGVGTLTTNLNPSMAVLFKRSEVMATNNN